ncbi:hypothetical protein C7S18_10895 [Ahniella affigens]|uniref:diguanylate cyclase n=1 Tax=Ahniella affigens TaxID=2021234 RepID=A0A2P1PS74_9GAMM|nr:diguanylate cyclase [Ahniella affigens]AVP97675.1 hypothetical protein C7S18_10895 [Ahniella affigens]
MTGIRTWMLPIGACLSLWLGMACAAVTSSEPPAIAALRANRAATVDVLEAQAIQAERRATDPVNKAWAKLAVAEFEDEQEHPERAQAMLLDLLKDARVLSLRDLEFAVLTRLASMLGNRGRTEEALQYIDRMNLIANAFDHAPWRAEVHYQRGVLDRKDGRPELAIRQFQKAQAQFEAAGDALGVAHTQNAMGMIFGRIGRFAEARLQHNAALEAATRLGNKQEMARSHRLLGNLYRNLEDEELGAENMVRALGMLEPRDRREGIALRGELGKSLLNLGRIGEAERYAMTAAEDAEASGSPPNKVNAFTTLAEVRLAQGRMDEAKEWSDRAMQQFNQVALRDQVLLRLSQLHVLSELGDYQEARSQGGRTVYDARRLGDKVLEREALDQLATVQLALGDAEAAFESRKAHGELDRELSLETASRKIAGLQADLDQARVEAEKKLLERDNQIQSLRITRQRWAGIALASAFFAVLGGLAFVSFRFRESQRLNAELKASRDELSRLHTALVETAAALDRAANTDSLTQLPNRRATMNVLDGVMQRFRTEGQSVALVLLDIDRFKAINDTYGHAEGDRVLQEMAARLRRLLPPEAHVGRWGGEEFLVVLSGNLATHAPRIVEDVRERLAEQAFQTSQGPISVTASFGLARLNSQETSGLVSVLARADHALYRAKALGRNRIEAV